MKKKKRAGKSYKNYYSGYKSKMTYKTNRIRRLLNHCSNYPEDTQASVALDSLSKEVPYRRKRSVHRGINSTNYPNHIFLKDYKRVNKNLINKLDLYPNPNMQLRPLSLREKLNEKHT